MDAEVEGEGGGVAGACAGECGSDRLASGGEDSEDAVAEELAFDGGAGVVADDGSEDDVEVSCLLAEDCVAEALGERGGVGDVGEEDGGHAGGEIFPAAKKAFDSGEYRIGIAVHLRRVAIKGNETRIGVSGTRGAWPRPAGGTQCGAGEARGTDSGS